MKLVYICLGWIFGILIAATTEALIPLFWLGVVSVVSSLTYWVWTHPHLRIRLIILLAFVLGGFRYTFVSQSSDIERYIDPLSGISIEGVVVEEPDIRDSRILLRVDTERAIQSSGAITTNGVVLVEASRATQVEYGDRVFVTGTLIRPPEFDTFSYADYLARSGVFAIMKNTRVEVVDVGQGSPIITGLARFKEQVQQIINRAVPEPQAALLSGILLGNERGIAPDVIEDFRKVGAAHIIAISGFNMVIVSSVIVSVLSHLTSRRSIVVAFGIGFVFLYTLFVGADAPVLRAAIMTSVVVIGQLIVNRRTYAPTSLAFVTLVMTLLDPTVLWDVGFQLSAFAVLGLALFSEPLGKIARKWLRTLFPSTHLTRIEEFLFEPLVVTLAAFIATTPLTILYFQVFSPVVLIVNLLIVPVQAVLLILGGISAVVGLVFPQLAQLLFWLDMVFLSWSIEVVRWFADLPFAQFEFYIDARLVVLFYASMIGGAMIAATRPKWIAQFREVLTRYRVGAVTSIMGGMVAILLFALFFSFPDGNLHVWFLDVGHSNAILIQSPGGAQLLVNGGRFPSQLLTAIGDRIPFHDQQLEVIVVTHPNEFDYAAIPDVLTRYDVGVALTNGQPNFGEAFQQLEMALASHDVEVVEAGYSLQFDDGMLVEVLHPQEQPDLSEQRNEFAMVLRVSFGDVSFLITSDVNRDGQLAILEEGQLHATTVMQLPNHGAQRGLDHDFLAIAQPQVVVIQADPANQLGHPHPDTLKMIEGIPLYRTDQQGALHFWTDGHELWVQSDV